MSSLLIFIIIFVIVIKGLDLIIVEYKDRKKYQPTPNQFYKKVNKAISNQIKEERPLYETPGNEGAIRWNKAFLRSLEWKRYEEVCMEYLRLKNCDANVTCIGADGGIDIKIHDKNGSLFAIGQCKSWAKPIGVSLIRELYGIMASERANYGIFLTTSTFSQEAKKFAENKRLILIDADEFINLISELKDDDKRRIDQVATEGDYTTPTCVHCNVKMVRRTATKGKNAGNDFWGCINYPKCKKIMFVKI